MSWHLNQSAYPSGLDQSLETEILKKRTAVGLFVALVASGSLGAWTYQDLHPYQVASSKVRSPEFIESERVAQQAANGDFDRIHSCETVQPLGDPDDASYDRTCLISALPQTASPIGGLLSAKAAVSWLQLHPDDEEVRIAALAAIGNARAALLSERRGIAILQEQSTAASQSLWRALFFGPMNSSDIFENSADSLDEAEFRVQMPIVAARQSAWRAQAYAN